jgi:multicomponent Na+:H+ antiporter subunit A
MSGVSLLVLIVLHAVAACGAPLLVRLVGRWAFTALATVPAGSLGWVAVRSAGLDGGAVVETTSWLPSLQLELAFRMDALAAVLAALVTAVGALVLVYCTRYFPAGAEGTGRLAGVLTGFAGAMLGLVLADNTLLLYVFWELTTVLSYLLVGHSAHRKSSRRAAMQALVVTTFGGLAMLVGLIVLGEQRSYLLSELVADPPGGALAGTAVVLVLLGALSKSALFPFHFWLPAAMAAPTPVSAYLHAAAMVKAGVYLVARLAPGFADAPVWRPLVITLGLATMLLGGWRALRQTDLKLLLAFGTVSQLGFLVVLVGAGTRDAALAGLAMLVAHALFKATLFLVVGAVDHAAGTRDLRELSGVARRMPVVTAAAVVAAASMAGLPPLAGFVGKEAAYEAFAHGALPSEAWSWVVLAGLVAGSALTAAYSARFVWGAFATKPGVPPATVSPSPLLLVAPPVLLALASAALGVGAPLLDRAVAPYADTLPSVGEGTYAYSLALWHGFSLPLLLSAVSLGGGALLFARRAQVDRFLVAHPGLGDADRSYRRLMRRVDQVAGAVTGGTQRGSLPQYLTVVLVVLLALPGTVLVVAGDWPASWRLWDTPVQLLVAVLVAAAAVLTTLVQQRLAAVVLVSVTGYGLAVLFVLHGAPDLALTQFLVESLTLVVFVLVLRKLPKQIVDRHTRRQRLLRLLVAVPAGLLMAGLGAAALGVRTSEPLTPVFAEEAYDFGGGRNIVNVMLVDIRAWDTIGEISVLVAAATGVASLVFLRHRTGAPPRVADASEAALARGRDTDALRQEAGPWLRGGNLLGAGQRSVVLEVVTRLIFHTVVVVSLYLLFAGHNVPGGGFAGGLVAGLALVVRYVAGGRYELGEAAPVDAGLLLGCGLLLAGGTGVAGLLLGAEVLQTAIIEGTLPLYGDAKLVTSLFFDIGVYLIVLGLVLDILRSLGAELDRQAASR